MTTQETSEAVALTPPPVRAPHPARAGRFPQILQAVRLHAERPGVGRKVGIPFLHPFLLGFHVHVGAIGDKRYSINPDTQFGSGGLLRSSVGSRRSSRTAKK